MASIPTQEEVLAATRKSQEAMMAAVKTWFDTFRTVGPKLTSMYTPLNGKLPKVGLPFADKLPTPQDAVTNAYHLAEQLLASQRKFAEDLVAATAPLWPGHSQSPAEVPSRNAWHNAVADSAPKTPAVSVAPKPVESPAPKAVVSTAPKAAESVTPKPAVSTAPKAAESTAPKAADSPAPKSTTASATSHTTAAKRTTGGSASTTGSARKSTATTSRKNTAAGSAHSTRKSTGSTTPAPKGTDAS